MDLAIGSGRMMVQSVKFQQAHSQSPDFMMYGKKRYDGNLRLCKMSLILRNMNFQVKLGDLLLDDKFPEITGNNSNDGLTALTPLKNIKSGFERIVADSVNPRIIYLLDGVYSASSNQEVFPLHPFSYLHISGTGDSLVILDAENNSNVIILDRDSAVEIKGLSITGGSTSNGGGIYVANSTAALKDLSINDNIASNAGGGVYCYVSKVGVENVSFLDNYSWSGGGLYSINSDNTINHVSFINNTAVVNGGGLYTEQSDVSLQNAVFSENSASYGGGLSVDSDTCNLQSVSITRNSATFGGGLYFSNTSPIFHQQTVATFTLMKLHPDQTFTSRIIIPIMFMLLLTPSQCCMLIITLPFQFLIIHLIY